MQVQTRCQSSKPSHARSCHASTRQSRQGLMYEFMPCKRELHVNPGQVNYASSLHNNASLVTAQVQTRTLHKTATNCVTEFTANKRKRGHCTQQQSTVRPRSLQGRCTSRQARLLQTSANEVTAPNCHQLCNRAHCTQLPPTA